MGHIVGVQIVFARVLLHLHNMKRFLICLSLESQELLFGGAEMKDQTTGIWLWSGAIMLAIGALGIFYGIRASITLGEPALTAGIWLLSPFLIPGTYFVTRGLGKGLRRPKCFWVGLALLYLGFLLSLVITAAYDVLSGVVVSAPLLGVGIHCFVWGIKRPDDLSQLPP